MPHFPSRTGFQDDLGSCVCPNILLHCLLGCQATDTILIPRSTQKTSVQRWNNKQWSKQGLHFFYTVVVSLVIAGLENGPRDRLSWMQFPKQRKHSELLGMTHKKDKNVNNFQMSSFSLLSPPLQKSEREMSHIAISVIILSNTIDACVLTQPTPILSLHACFCPRHSTASYLTQAQEHRRNLPVHKRKAGAALP